MISPLAWVIIIPLIGVILACVWRSRAVWVSLVTCVINVGMCLSVLREVGNQGAHSVLLGGWSENLAIVLHVDHISSLLLVMTSVLYIIVTIYAVIYVKDKNYRRHFWPLWLQLLVSLNALFLSRDLFNIYVALELLGISAVALAVLQQGSDALYAGLRYLLLGLMGSLLYLLGVILIYIRFGTLDWLVLSSFGLQDLSLWFALATMSAGLLLKCALFPLHFWLPNTHANAPAPVSAVLSALVVKAAFYLILRLWMELGGEAMAAVAIFLSLLGAVAVLWGSFAAFRATRLKLLAAYSTVAQVGYLFLFLPQIALATEHAHTQQLVAAMLVFLASHAFAKASLFLSAGYLQHRFGHDTIAELTGLSRTAPLTTLAIGLAGVALIGLPPSGGFLGKWYLLSDLMSSANWGLALVMTLGTLLAASYTFKVLAITLSVTPEGSQTVSQTELGSESNETLGGSAGLIQTATLLAVIATLGLGLFSNTVWPFLGRAGI